jgi:hypothetical protein
LDDEACPDGGTGIDLEATARGCRAIAQIGKAMMPSRRKVRRVEAHAVVRDLEDEVVADTRQSDLEPRCA